MRWKYYNNPEEVLEDLKKELEKGFIFRTIEVNGWYESKDEKYPKAVTIEYEMGEFEFD